MVLGFFVKTFMNKTSTSQHFDVIVIGGGASGMMASIVASSKGKRVLVIEKNKQLGAKLSISGGGRCNITNAEFDTRALLSHYGKSAEFLFSPFSQFGVKDTFSFFELLGLPIVVQARNRAFPETEKATDVVSALRREMQRLKVEIKANTIVKEIKSENKKATEVVTSSGIFSADTFILSTGGVSHPETGSTGDGFNWLKKLGHTIKSPTPTIVPIAVYDKWVHALSGVSLSFMRISFYLDGKKKLVKVGKVLFTHFGLSGPLILNIAGNVGWLLESGQVTAVIDAYPDTDSGQLEAKVIAVFDKNKNKLLKNILKEVVPDGMTPAIQMLLQDKINFEKKVHSVTKDERKLLVKTLKALPISVKGLMGYDRAVVADGGVPLNEVDTKTMRSNKIENLFVTGDLLHVNRPSGGYSLQLCWTTGFVAGNNA